MRKSSEIRRYALWFCFALGLIHIGTIDTNAGIRLWQHESQMAALDEIEWSEFHADAVEEYSAQFDALFNSYEVKFSKNGRTMIRQGDSGSFKFVAKQK